MFRTLILVRRPFGQDLRTPGSTCAVVREESLSLIRVRKLVLEHFLWRERMEEKKTAILVKGPVQVRTLIPIRGWSVQAVLTPHLCAHRPMARLCRGTPGRPRAEWSV